MRKLAFGSQILGLQIQRCQMTSSIPQIRSLPESVVEGPAFKKQRIEMNDVSDTRLLVETAIQIEA